MDKKVAAVFVLLVAALVACIIYIVVGISDDTIKFVLVAVLAVVTGVFAVRFSVSLDLNRFFEDRREQNRRRARSLCPHVDLIPNERAGGDRHVIVQNAYFKPQGTIQYRCQKCGDVSYGPLVEDNFRRWRDDLVSLLDRIEEFNAALKKING